MKAGVGAEAPERLVQGRPGVLAAPEPFLGQEPVEDHPLRPDPGGGQVPGAGLQEGPRLLQVLPRVLAPGRPGAREQKACAEAVLQKGRTLRIEDQGPLALDPEVLQEGPHVAVPLQARLGEPHAGPGVGPPEGFASNT